EFPMLAAILTAATLSASGAPAVTPGAPSAAPPVSSVTVTGKSDLDKKADHQNEVVCRSETVLGTLFPKRFCATRGEMAERTRQDQDQLRKDTSLRPYDINSGLPTLGP